MKNKEVNHNEFINEVQVLLRGIPHETVNFRDGKVFTVMMSKPMFGLEITINSRWVGYEFLYIDSNNRKIGFGEDTDLYPLDFKPSITLEIFKELKTFILQLKNREILFGTQNNSSIIARPISSKSYEVKVYKRKRWWQNKAPEILEVSKKELSINFSLDPIE